MPTLPNPSHEIFCQARSKGLALFESAVEAGYPAREGARLGRRKDIQRRISELLDDVSVITKINISWVLGELRKNHEIAREVGDLSASNKALELIGKDLGMFRDKLDVDVSLTRKLIVERLTDEQAEKLTEIVRLVGEDPDEH